MKRNAIRSLVVMMIAGMVFAFTPVPVAAATKAPAMVKISSVKVAAVSTSTNKTTVTIKWKKAKRATGYIVWVKHGTGQWVKQIKLGKRYRKLKLMGVPAGQFDVKVQAVNKKKKGKYSKVKSKYIKSPHTLASYATSVRPSMKIAAYGVTKTFSGNTLICDYDVAKINYRSTLTAEELETIKAQVNADQATKRNETLQDINSMKLDEGISGVTVIYRYIYNNNVLLSFTYR